jgi:hypothetical protein
MKSKIKAIIVAAMLATTALSAQSAYAADPTFEVVSQADGSFSGTFGHIFDAPTTSFTDLFTFSIDKGFSSSTSITSSYSKLGNKIKDVSIGSFDLIKYSGDYSNIVTTYAGLNTTASTPNAKDEWEITVEGLTAGDYYVRVSGSVLGNIGGSYAGEIQVLTVPEPETYGMMLGGLALVGLVARRKAAKKAAQA